MCNCLLFLFQLVVVLAWKVGQELQRCVVKATDVYICVSIHTDIEVDRNNNIIILPHTSVTLGLILYQQWAHLDMSSCW